MVFAECRIKLSSVSVNFRERPLCPDNSVTFSREEEIGPGDDPKHAEVEQEANPGRQTPAVEGVRGVDVNGAIFDRKGNFYMAFVVCGSDEALQSVAEKILIQTRDSSR